MTTEQIGQAAGIIWHTLLESDKPVNISEVPKKTKLTSQVAYLGLGWLAREGKVDYQKKGRSVYVSLSA
jgi:hypothetical protein